MEVRKKLALSIFASFSLVSMAFAGGPETPAIDMNGVNIGAGISYKSYKYDLTQTDFTGTNVATANQAPTVDALGVAGQIGYTAAGDHWIFGILGQYEYANIHNYTDDSGVQIGGAQVNLRSRFNGMILGGIRASDADVAYLEFGYTAAYLREILSIRVPAGAGAGNVTGKEALNGGIFGAGWRHYFSSSLFTDLSYTFSLYSNGNMGLIQNTTLSTATQTTSEMRKLTVNGLSATANYLFSL